MGRGKHKTRRARKKAEQNATHSGAVKQEEPVRREMAETNPCPSTQRISLGITDDNFVPNTSQKRGKKKNKTLMFTPVKDSAIIASSNTSATASANNINNTKINGSVEISRLHQQNIAGGQSQENSKCSGTSRSSTSSNVSDKKVKQSLGEGVLTTQHDKPRCQKGGRGNSASNNKENKCANVDSKDNSMSKKQKKKKKQQQQQQQQQKTKQQPSKQQSNYMSGSDLLACPKNTVLDEATLKYFIEHPAELAELRLVKPAKVALLFNTGHTEHWAKSPECHGRLIVWDEAVEAEYDPTIQCIPGKVQELIQRQRQQQTVHKTDLIRKMKCKTYLKCCNCGYRSNVMPLQ